MEDFLTGTALLFTNPAGIVIFIAGLLGGLVFCAVPGLSMLTLAAVLLPFTAWMSSEHAIMLYGVIYVAQEYPRWQQVTLTTLAELYNEVRGEGWVRG